MTWRVFSLIAALSTIAQAEKCGSRISPERMAAAEQKVMDHFRLKGNKVGDLPGVINIPVTWNVIYINETIEGGLTPNNLVEDTVKTLNEAWSGSLFFNLEKINKVENANWYSNVYQENDLQTEMKKTLRVGGAGHLNMYTVGFENPPANTTSDLLGYATFPESYASNPLDDGVIMRAGTIRGGIKEGYNLGATLVHEVGHWLGLYHTFQGGCDDPNGDYVDDTPPEASSASGCMIGRDTCPGGGPDPVTNYMDYSDDSCLTQFTAGQRARVAKQWEVYRNNK